MPEQKVSHTLRSKIFLRITLVVGFAVVASGLFSIAITRNAIQERTFAELQRITTERSDNLARILRDRRTLTRTLALDAQRLQSESTASIRKRLLQQRDAAASLKELLIIDMDGTVLIATDSQRERQGVSSLDAFQRGKKATFVGPVNIAGEDKIHMTAAPIRSIDGKQLGVLIAEFRAGDVLENLQMQQRIGRTEEIFLAYITDRGTDCFNVRKRSYEDPFSTICSLALSRGEGIVSRLTVQGAEVVAARAFSIETGYGIVTKMDRWEVFRPVNLLLTTLVGTTGILLFLVAFVSLRLSRDVVGPITTLQKGLQALDTGHWSYEPSIQTGDELQILDTEAGRLAKRLSEAHGSLEERIAERTEDLKKEHAKVEALVESIGDGVLAIDMDGNVVACNSTGKDLLGWNEEQMIGAHFSGVLVLRTDDGKLIPPNDHFVQRTMKEKVTIRTHPRKTSYCERKDNSVFPISLTTTPYMIGTDMKGIVVTFRDVSEEKHIELMKSEFISLASHQLRTPLTAMSWYIELLQNEIAEKLEEDQKSYIDQIVQSTQRMVKLVNSLLNVSRIELGRIKINPEKKDLVAITKETIQELEPQVKERALALEVDLPETQEVQVDPQLVQIVLENILTNAIKYTPADGKIELSLSVGPQECRFKVKDTGYGIPKRQQKHIFEKLFRAENIQDQDTTGTGIGLYIAKSVVEAWQGRLWFESESEQGTTFYFTVPLKMEKAEENRSEWLQDRKNSLGKLGDGAEEEE